MPFTESRTLSTKTLLYRIAEGELNICPPFQRGTTESGVWGKRRCNAFIQSFMRGYPYGNITTVTRDRNDEVYILDGAHRARCLRDFFAGDLRYDGKAYTELTSDEQAQFKATQIPIVEVRLDRDDPGGTVTRMYVALQQGISLSTGELLHARAWQGAVPIIDLARFMVNGTREAALDTALLNHDGNREQFEEIRRRWLEAFGEVRPGTRHKRLAFFTGVLLSIARGSCSFLTMKYRHLDAGLDNLVWTQAAIEGVLTTLGALLDMVATMGTQDVSRVALGARVGCPSSLLLPIILEPTVRGMTSTQWKRMRDHFRQIGSSNNAMHSFRNDIEEIVGRASHYTTPDKLAETIRLILPNYSSTGENLLVPLEAPSSDSGSDDINAED